MTTDIDFRATMLDGATVAKSAADKLEQDVLHLREVSKELAKWGSDPAMNQPRIEYHPDKDPDFGQFEVYIPPFNADHFEGDAIMGPFHVSYWKTWDEAKKFLDEVLRAIEAGEYGPIYHKYGYRAEVEPLNEEKTFVPGEING